MLAEILHLSPTDVDGLTLDDFDRALEYVTERMAARGQQ
jgi:hypothetical protein